MCSTLRFCVAGYTFFILLSDKIQKRGQVQPTALRRNKCKTIVGTIKYISDKVRQKADNNLKDHNLTLSQVRVLRFLTCVGGSCSQKEIEDYLQVSHPTVVGIVSRMEQSGFLQTDVCSKDKRNKIVTMTDKGNNMSLDLRRYMEQYEQDVLRGLTDDDKVRLAELLDKIACNLRDEQSNN